MDLPDAAGFERMIFLSYATLDGPPTSASRSTRPRSDPIPDSFRPMIDASVGAISALPMGAASTNPPAVMGRCLASFIGACAAPLELPVC